MTDDRDLSQRLGAYPYLLRALGDAWIAEQEGVDPIDSPYRLARWLRIDGFARDLAGLDAALARLDGVDGIADRRRRLRADPLGFAETLTELHAAVWLLDHGHRFAWPRAGADFAVELGGGPPLRMEATTPRKAVWSDDLFERLDLIARRTGFGAEVEHELETLPDPALSDELVARVAREAAALLEDAVDPTPSPVPSPLVQEYPEAGLKITWSRDAEAYIAASTSPPTTSPYTGWGYLVAAAAAKARQLPADEAGVLLLGTRQIPTLAWEHFLDALRHYRPEDLPLDWSLLPPQVAVVVLYPFVLREPEPLGAMYLINPASPFPVRSEVTEFFRALFPAPIRRSSGQECSSGGHDVPEGSPSSSVLQPPRPPMPPSVTNPPPSTQHDAGSPGTGQPHSTYAVVLRGTAGLHFGPPTGHLLLRQFPTNAGPVDLTFRSRRVPTAGFSRPIRRGLMVDVRGAAPSLRVAVEAFGNAARGVAVVLGLSANVPVGPLQVELAFDATPGHTEREFFQRHLSEEPLMPHPGRMVLAKETSEVLLAVAGHADGDRIYRAVVHYADALLRWEPGAETLAVAALWMGVESLTPVARRRELARTGLSQHGLVQAWGIEVRQLDAEVRRRILFRGDDGTYRKAKDASDAFEHSFRAFTEVRTDAAAVRDATANHLRAAILDLAAVGPAAAGVLLAHPFDRPIWWTREKYAFGRLIGTVRDLAQPDQDYPLLRWASSPVELPPDEFGDPGVDMSECISPSVGDEMTFELDRLEVWGPPLDEVVDGPPGDLRNGPGT